ncbi:MAG: phosphoribosylamine--glycine ligase [Clostridiales bacterium]|nr:phosphoribosylamine--glycine ligase [Clostridiales bacterium]
MKILLVGSGGREHAILIKLLESIHVSDVICAPGNGGMAKLAKCFDVGAMDIEGMIQLAKGEVVDMVFVAPDDPLAIGMVDKMEQSGIKAFGPNKKAAQIEASKVFAKDLMKKYNIPTAAYEVFTDATLAKEYIKKIGAPIVIKADGLALGKGVYVALTDTQALSAVDEIMVDKKFGKAGARIVVEEFLQGPEVSLLCFTDSKTIKPMVSSQDHKRAYDNDEGPNTGGMGAFAPSHKYTKDIAKVVEETILYPTMHAMNSEGCPFKGVLYFGLILTTDGPKVIEYNSRFGDPEAQVVLPLLSSDFYEIIEAVYDERLEDAEVTFKDAHAAVIVMASGGYPVSYKKGYEINGLDDLSDAIVYHAGVRLEDGKYLTNGGRVLGVTAQGDTLDEAISKAYDGVGKIKFKDAHFRRDIGRK